MTGIIVQQEFKPGLLVSGQPAARIPFMPKKRGPYLRNTPKHSGDADHFIREWREWAGLTQETLAERSGLSVASVSAYERGESDPSMGALDALAKAIGVSRGMLLDVNPFDDPPLWAGFTRASKAQKEEIGRIVGALVGPLKAKN
jgi:transcriptional regulator with XRE-family HTH domain